MMRLRVAPGQEVYERTVFSRKDPRYLGTRGCPDGHPRLDRFPPAGTRFRVRSSRIRCNEGGAAHAGFNRWAAVKRRLRLNTPREPTTGVPRARLWLWVVPFLVAVVVVELVLNTPIENAWVSVFPFLAEPEGYSLGAILGSQEVLQRLVSAWWFFALYVITAVFNTILGEEFLFRGVLLPRMEGVFGRWSWVANNILFGLYHVHVPWVIPNAVLTGLLYTFPAYRYRSTWMSIILHSAQSVYFAFLVLGVVLGLA
jgi:uncharacterized protein